MDSISITSRHCPTRPGNPVIWTSAHLRRRWLPDSRFRGNDTLVAQQDLEALVLEYALRRRGFEIGEKGRCVRVGRGRRYGDRINNRRVGSFREGVDHLDVKVGLGVGAVDDTERRLSG